MWIWLETAGVVLLALLGALTGWRLSRLRHPWWLLGYILPLALLLMIGFARHFPILDFKVPFRWFTLGRLEFARLSLDPPGEIAPQNITCRFRHLGGAQPIGLALRRPVFRTSSF